jgi:hypothetical protein
MIGLILFIKTIIFHPLTIDHKPKACLNTVLLLYNIGILKHCSIDEKKENKGMTHRLCLGISLPLVYRANITLEKD